MAGRIPGSSIRVLSNMLRGAGKAGKSNSTEKVNSSLFAGHTVSIASPTPELRSLLVTVGDKWGNEERGKSLSDYTVSTSAGPIASLEHKANVGATEELLGALGISSDTLNALQSSIQDAFHASVNMMPARIETVAVGVKDSLNSMVQSLLQFVKNSD